MHTLKGSGIYEGIFSEENSGIIGYLMDRRHAQLCCIPNCIANQTTSRDRRPEIHT